MGAASIMGGMGDLVVAGGVEMMSYVAAEGIQRPSMLTMDLRARPQTR